MALTKPTPQKPATDAAEAVKPAGSFETMDETTTSKSAANDTESAVAPAPATAVVTLSKGEASAFAREVTDMKGGADFSYGNYAVFKGINGNIKGTGDNKANLGRWVKVSMIAWDDRIQISPGSDTDKAKECVAYSKDGTTIDSVIGRDKYGSWVGKSVNDYIEHLKDSDWPHAKASRYIDVACVVHEGETKAAKELAGEIICISLSSSSIPSFAQYQEKLNMKAVAIKRGIPGVVIPADPFTFYFGTEAASKDGKDWTKLKVTDKQPSIDE